MKKLLLLTGLCLAATAPAFGQGFINFAWFNSFSTGIQVGSPSNPSSQLAGWYCGSDYSVQAYMAAGTGQAEGSLTAVAALKTVMGYGSSPTSASGGPGDATGNGLIGGQPGDTGLALGIDTIQVRVWYSGGGATTYEAALAAGVNAGKSALYNITGKASSDPTIQSLDDVGLLAFTVSGGAVQVPEPSTFALAGLGAAALLIFRRRK